MSTTKKFLLAAGGALGLLIVVLLALPLFFLDDIEARVRADIARATRVTVDWDDVGLTLFRDFPHPTLSLSGLTVVGTGSFEGDTLASVVDFGLALDGPSALAAFRGTGPLVVRSVTIDRPALRLSVDEDGIASWDVFPPREAGAPEDGTGRGIAVSLRSFELSDGSIVLDDATSGTFLQVAGLNHSLRGDFSRDALVARTNTTADAVTMRLAGAPYLSDVALGFDADLDVDMAERRARLGDNELRLNDLVLRLQGDVARQDDRLALDLAFDAPSTEFGQVLSLLPALYAQDFASLETSGTFTLAGTVRGTYAEGTLPAFSLDLSVADGRFRYPDLPLPAEAIAAELSVTNPGGDLDGTVLDLSRFHVEIGGQPFDATMALRTPLSDPDADVTVRGTLDLGDVARTVKIERMEGLDGVIVADAAMRARRSDVDSERYDQIDARGTITARELALRGETLRQPIDVREATLALTPRTAELRSLDARLGSSDVRATGRLDNLLGFVLGADPLRGSVRVDSDRLVLDEWRSGNALTAIPVPDRLDLTLDGTVRTLVFNGLEMTNARGAAVVRDRRLTLDGFSLETLGGRIGMDGWYETLDPARPTFALDLDLDSLDVAGASAAFLTVRTLAPVAAYARGAFSSALSLSGALGPDLSPEFDVLDGDGTLSTSRIAIEGFPLLDRLSETLQLQRLSNPTVDAVRSSVHIRDGRLVVDPFGVNVGGLAMSVSGSNGFDRSIDYALGVQVPRAGFADDALSSLAARAGPLGAGLAAADPVRVTVRATGSVTQPSLSVGLAETAGTTQAAVRQAAEAEVGQRIDEAQQDVDAAREEALLKARAEADSIVAEAERQAATIRAEAARAAEQVRAEGGRAADEVLARATNPLARAAAQPAADRIRREAEEQAATIEREADEQATALVEEARARADALVAAAGG